MAIVLRRKETRTSIAFAGARPIFNSRMTTLTLTLEDAAAGKARQVAREKQTSLEDMLRQFVMRLSQGEAEDHAAIGR